jgi:hypothetical protein
MAVAEISTRSFEFFSIGNFLSEAKRSKGRKLKKNRRWDIVALIVIIGLWLAHVKRIFASAD